MDTFFLKSFSPFQSIAAAVLTNGTKELYTHHEAITVTVFTKIEIDLGFNQSINFFCFSTCSVPFSEQSGEHS